jgi:Fe-S-cluster containining protein
LKDRRLVKVWTVNTFDRGRVRVATIEQGERKPAPCEGCSAPCCRSFLRPILTAEEFLSKKYPVTLIQPEPWLKRRVPRIQYFAALAFKDGKCPYFNSETNKCKLWPNPPKACLAYSCLEDTRPEVRRFVEEHVKPRIGGESFGRNGVH